VWNHFLWKIAKKEAREGGGGLQKENLLDPNSRTWKKSGGTLEIRRAVGKAKGRLKKRKKGMKKTRKLGRRNPPARNIGEKRQKRKNTGIG